MNQVSRCPPLRYGAVLSSLAMSGLAFSVAPLTIANWLLYLDLDNYTDLAVNLVQAHEGDC